MRIYFDNIIFSLQKAGGISAVWVELLKRIPVEHVVAYFEGRNSNMHRKEIFIPVGKIISTSCRFLNVKKFFNIRIKDRQTHIYHSSCYRLSKNKNSLNIITVHDFIVEYYGSFFVKLLKSHNKRRCILTAKAIICVSENTKTDLIKFIPNIDVSKIYVVYNGKSEVFKMDNTTPLELKFDKIKKNEFILFVGQRKGYKNFMTLIDAIVLYNKKKLVIVGGGNLTKTEKKYLDSVLGNNNYIHYLGIDNECLNVLYNNAYCFVYPSLYEGFGIPVIEAQSAGCPVITTNTSSLSEILGDSAILLNSVSSKTIMDALFSLEDQSLKEHLISLGLKNAEKYSWDVMSESYLKIYQEIWNKYIKIT